MLTREQLLAAVPKPRPVRIPELGDEVFIRPLTGLERDAFELAQYERRHVHKQPPNLRGALVARCVVTADGQRVFTDEDEERVGQMAAPILEPLFEAAQQAAGMSDADVKALGEDSSASPGGASPSASPGN